MANCTSSSRRRSKPEENIDALREELRFQHQLVGDPCLSQYVTDYFWSDVYNVDYDALADIYRDASVLTAVSAIRLPTNRLPGFRNSRPRPTNPPKSIDEVAGGEFLDDTPFSSPAPKVPNEIPTKATDTLKYIKSNGSPQPGYKGGRTFHNDGRGGGEILPTSDVDGDPITYKEYDDVNPYVKCVDRGREPIVIGSDGSSYFTRTHYETFIRIE